MPQQVGLGEGWGTTTGINGATRGKKQAPGGPVVREGHLFVQQSESNAPNFVAGLSLTLPSHGKPGWRLRLHPDLGGNESLPQLTIVRFDRNVEREDMRGTLKLICTPSQAGGSEVSEQVR